MLHRNEVPFLAVGPHLKVRWGPTARDWLSVSSTLTYPAPAGNEVDKPEQENSAKKRCEERPDNSIAFDPEQTQNGTTDQTPDDAYNDIPQDSQLITLDQPVSKCARKATNYNPNDPSPECSQNT